MSTQWIVNHTTPYSRRTTVRNVFDNERDAIDECFKLNSQTQPEAGDYDVVRVDKVTVERKK